MFNYKTHQKLSIQYFIITKTHQGEGKRGGEHGNVQTRSM